jgi:glycerol-3-phosphate acyltransferase PlsY
LTPWKIIGWTVASYLIGAVPFGLILSRTVFGKDVRQMGSGNIGATNILRNFGRTAFIAVLLLDALKGAVAVVGARWLGLTAGYIILAGLAAISGHVWSIYLRFKGGKGIATGAGVLLAAFPWQITLSVVGVFLVLLLLTRYMSVSSMLAATSLPLAVVLYNRTDLGPAWPYLAFSLLVLGIVLYRHKDNLRRLRQGSEPKISFRRKPLAGAG